jgi:hypothetical protein
MDEETAIAVSSIICLAVLLAIALCVYFWIY